MTAPSFPADRPLFYTGRSPFLAANRFFMASLWRTSQRCPVESSEDIYDQSGFKLWAGHRPLQPELLERLADRPLRKPIELCMQAQDPAQALALGEMLDHACERSPDLAEALAGSLGEVRGALTAVRPNPQELLLMAVLRHGGRDLLAPSVVVAAVALALAQALKLERGLWPSLLWAGLLHDVGRLYFAADVAGAQAEEVRVRHPMVGARAAVELADSRDTVGQLIACADERLDGSGVPRGLAADALPQVARILLFAKAVAPSLAHPDQGALRAALSVRMVRREFDAEMINWMVAVEGRCAPRKPVPGAPGRIGLRLRDLHAGLSRVVVLLSLPVGEVAQVREACQDWLTRRLNPLVLALRASGVEGALSRGESLDPDDPHESAELEALWAEVLSRALRFGQFLELEAGRLPALANSQLVETLLQILNSLAPQPASIPCPEHS